MPKKRPSPVAKHIEEYGFHVVKVMGEQAYPPFAYTIGLTVSFDHPEIVIFGLNDDLDFMHEVLNELGARVRGGERFRHGDKKRDVLPGYTCPFARFPASAYEEHLGQALEFLAEPDFPVVQCIWPDPKKRLPWDPKVMPPVLARQPVFLRPDAGPKDPVWPFADPHSRRAITTIQVVTGKQPVRFVGRFADGDWQFVCETTQDEDDIVITTLGWLLDHDPTLKAVAKLEPGEGRVRTSVTGRWKPADPDSLVFGRSCLRRYAERAMRRFELSDGTSNKFWQIERDDTSVRVQFGRIGTNGQAQEKSFATAAAATSEHDKLVKEKLKKGYVEVDGAGVIAIAPAAVVKPARQAPAAAPAPVVAPAPAQAVPGAAPPSAAATPEPAATPAPSVGPRIAWTDAALRAASPIRGSSVVPARAPDAAPVYARLARAMKAFEPMLEAGKKAQRADVARMAAAQAAFAGVEPPEVLDVESQATAFALIGPMLSWNDESRVNDFACFWLAKAGPDFALSTYLRAVEIPTVASEKSLAVVSQAPVETPWWRTRNTVPWRALRLVAALADDAEHAALLARAEACCGSAKVEVRAALAAAFERPSWCDADIAGVTSATATPDWFWPLLASAADVDEATALLGRTHQQNVWYLAAAMDDLRFDMVARYGLAITPFLIGIVEQAGQSGVDRLRSIAEALALIVDERVASLFVKNLGAKELRAIASSYLMAHPEVAVVPLAEAACGKGATADAARAVLKLLVASEKGEVAGADARLSGAARALVATLAQQVTPGAEATPDELPDVLRSPPWARRVKTEAPVVLDLSSLSVAEAIAWRPGEREGRAQGWVAEEPDQVAKHVAAVKEACSFGPYVAPRGYRQNAAILLRLPLEALVALLPDVDLTQLDWSYHDVAGVLLARHGLAMVELALKSAAVDAGKAVSALSRVRSARVAPLMAEGFLRLKKARADAGEWLLAFPEAAATGLLPLALGKPGRARESAEVALRYVASRGHRAAIEAVAKRYGKDAERGAAQVLDFDPLLVFPARLPRMPAFWNAGAFTRPALAGTRKALPVSAVDAIGTMLAFTATDDPYPGVAQVKAACEAGSLADFAWDLFQAWLASGAPSKEAWAFRALGLLGDDETARRLAPLVRAWPGEAAHARAVLGLDVLATIGTDVALMHLHGIAQKLKFKGLQEKAREKIDQIAEARGLTADELADRLVPDLGLEDDGSLVLDFGPRSFRVVFDETLKPAVLDESGKRLPDLPKPKQSDDADKAQPATEAWKALKKDAKAIATGQLLRLELAMCAQRRWTVDVFRQFLLGHPLLVHVVRRLVWGTYTADGTVAACFRVAEDSSLADVEDDVFPLPDDARIGIVHRLDLDDDAAARWGQILSDYEILQPFAQLAREVVRPTDAERAGKTIDHVAGITVPTGKVLGLDARGWRRGPTQDGGVVCWYEKHLPGGLVACLDLEPGIYTGMVSESPEQKLGGLTLSQGEVGWSGDQAVPFDRLAPIPLSELLRDLASLRPLVRRYRGDPLAEKRKTEGAGRAPQGETPQRPPAEVVYAAELDVLRKDDDGPRPPGWKLSPMAVRAFILGDPARKIRKKFVGNPSLVDRAMVALATNRGLMLVGEPGTAKSLLSELLSAAICGRSTLTIQGSAGTTDDQIKYSWNYALLLAEGPTPRALVPAPLHTGMRDGAIVRFEEITRCPLEIQDSLLAALSDRVLAIPEMEGEAAMLFAREGFNVIATANTRDLGVNEMSAALKRRFNFETVFPIPDFSVEMELVREETKRLLERSGVPHVPGPDVLELLVTTFRELRAGQTVDGQAMDRLSVPMSTAEAVSVAYAVGVRSHFLQQAEASPVDLVECLIGAAIKTEAEDVARLRRYFEQRVSKGQGPHWRAYYEARHRLPGLGAIAMALHVVGVRHHSPACARLVDQTIRRLAPRFVLIEGPCDMNDRLGELALPHELPVALFSYRQDASGTQRATWSPFCDYSPEWVALSAARDVGATALFVDLPSWDPAFDGEENRYSDRHARASDRLAELCARLGFEDTDAVWDHLFEQPEDEACRQSRLSRYFEALRGDEPGGPRDGPREDFMCRYVKWAISEAGDRDVVLVCGGYHKPAIERAWASAVGGRPEPPAPGPDVRVGSYLVPFSFRRLDSFSGYASGMPSPGFYQALWDQGHDRAPEAMLFAAVRHLRAQRLRVSPADAIAASTLAHGLRALRGHDVLTRIDVLDGLAGALVKDALESPLPWTRRGTLSPRTEPLLVEIVAAFSGSKIGKLAPGTPRPPLVDDAFAELERARIAVTREKQRVVAVLTTPAGVLQSSVLHRLRVLGIPGFVQTRAPSLARGKTELSEEWTVHHLLETDPALIEASAYGATLEGAAAARLEERSRDATDVAVVADALVDAALCGIRSLTQRGLADVARLVATEPSFGSLGAALAKLLALRRGDLVLGERGKTELGAVIAACFDRGLWLFEGVRGPSAPLDEALVSAVRALRDVLRVGKEGRPALDVDAERARAVCERRTHDPGTPPALRGAALGLLWSLRDASVDAEPGEDDASRTVDVLRAVARPETFGDLLAGLFALAREQVICAPSLLAMVDATVTGFLAQDFLVALPGLRQAFSYFPPRERLAIAEAVLALGHDEAPGVLRDPRTLLDARVDVAAVQRAATIEREALALATRFGLRDALDGGDA